MTMDLFIVFFYSLIIDNNYLFFTTKLIIKYIIFVILKIWNLMIL